LLTRAEGAIDSEIPEQIRFGLEVIFSDQTEVNPSLVLFLKPRENLRRG
jgi:hypothetical protein